MPTDRPDSIELINAVRDFLRNAVQPNVSDQLAFHVQVAGNLLGMVERMLESGEAMDGSEQQRLRQLLQMDGDLVSLNRELVERINSGAMDATRGQLLDHLRATVEDKLQIANPRYLSKNSTSTSADNAQSDQSKLEQQ